MRFCYYKLAYDPRGEVTCHESVTSSHASDDSSFAAILDIVARALAGGVKEIPIHLGSIKGTRILFLPPAPLFEVYRGTELLSVHLHLRGVNAQLEQLAAELFETKVRLAAPEVFQRANPLKLVHLTRVPLAASLRLPLASCANSISAFRPLLTVADVSDVADELVLLAAYENDRSRRTG